MVVALLILVLVPVFPVAQANTSFVFNKFHASNLALIGNASLHFNAIRLTNQSQHVFGRAMYTQPVRMKDMKSMEGTFSFCTSFIFSMVPPSNLQGQHGLAFIMMSAKSPEAALESQFLQTNDSSRSGQAYNHLFAVDFETGLKEDFNGIHQNHVGVHLNDLISVRAGRAGYWSADRFQEVKLNDGQKIQAWIDYDHLQQRLNVTIVHAGSSRPLKPLISLSNISLCDILEQEMYIGFSAATGTLVQDHYIIAWNFSTNGVAPTLNISHLPSNSNSKLKLYIVAGLATALILLAVSFVVVAAIAHLKRKKRHRDLAEEWEMEYWPHRFDYRDLHIATNGFREEQLLGIGGCGRVYRGILPTNGLEVAIKCILKETTEGMKQFIAEISSLGRLQHRNLVQIRGFCRREYRLFIVYDYMPNGSLDNLIFGKPKSVLGWAQRYRILRDVAAGLVYLHEEWEQRVVHRDIKSSNVLLDSELNGKLGDFGLARLYDHSQNSLTTRVVGTLGYIAQELIHTGKATPATDVFSFGILMMEVACGRSPVDTSLDAAQLVMVDWVRELHGKDSLMDAADTNLGGEFVKDEMERVLKLGLLCSNPHAEGRPGMRQVLQILEGEASLPGFETPFYSDMGPTSNSRKSTPYYSSSYAYTSSSLEGR